MSFWIALLNDCAVSLFGSVLSASFCDALSTEKKRWIFSGCMVVLLVLQAVAYTWWDGEVVRKIYPLILHVPLLVVLACMTKRVLWPTISILTAYLSCQLRRWVALLVVTVLSGGSMMQNVVELVVTVPLLLLLLRRITPAVRPIRRQEVKTQLEFGLIPAVYYGFDYLTRVYTNLLPSGDPAAVEFMPFVCCVSYLVFMLHHSAEERARDQLRQVQSSLNLQLTQAVREIDALRESQELTRRYRHDLRHHLQYLAACLENGQTEQAQEYISGICREIEGQTVQRYCKNEAANLILSSFAGRAEKSGISMHIQGTLPASIPLTDSDLCVLLSNTLENALHASQTLVREGQNCTVQVQFYEKSGRLFLQVDNPCDHPVTFRNGRPVTQEEGHGLGVQSICAIVERYGGVYNFFLQSGRFFAQISL